MLNQKEERIYELIEKIDDLKVENFKLRQTISTLEEQISWVEKGNKRLRKKLKKYKQVLKLLEEKLELGLNKQTEKFMIDDSHYFENNYYYIACCNGNREITYLENELLQEVLNEKED